MNNIEKPTEESDFLTLAPTEDDMDIVQSDIVIASGAVSTNVDKGPTLVTVPADPYSLVKNSDKAIRDLRAMVEELQQVCSDNAHRQAESERQLSQQKREIITLKKRRTDSAGGS